MGDKTPWAARSTLSEGGPFWEVRLPWGVVTYQREVRYGMFTLVGGP